MDGIQLFVAQPVMKNECVSYHSQVPKFFRSHESHLVPIKDRCCLLLILPFFPCFSNFSFAVFNKLPTRARAYMNTVWPYSSLHLSSSILGGCSFFFFLFLLIHWSSLLLLALKYRYKKKKKKAAFMPCVCVFVFYGKVIHKRKPKCESAAAKLQSTDCQTLLFQISFDFLRLNKNTIAQTGIFITPIPVINWTVLFLVVCSALLFSL